MRTLTFTILFVLAVGITWQCARPLAGLSTIAGVLDDPAPLRDSIKNVMKALADPGFSKNELIVFLKQPSSPERIDQIKEMMRQKGIDPSSITIRTCNACSASIQLWQAPNIYTYVVTEGVRSGSGGGGSNGVGEDSLARYSLNFTSQLPVDALQGVSASLANYIKRNYPVNNLKSKDVVKIAVLDTGVDTVRFIHNSYLWTNGNESANGADDDKNCYADDVAGWNFLNNTPDFRDNNTNIHGSLVTKYIIDQFQSSATLGVQVMALKTHDENGVGNLFANICALHYAIDNGAQIINTSWGFYNYGDNPVPYLDSLVTQVLPRHGILFVTAAGNKLSDEEDNYARSLYRAMHHGAAISDAGLRNLQIHNFYPAMFSHAGNNVITATTTDGIHVSPTQNFSSLHVDLGVQSDRVIGTAMKFRVPFDMGTENFISGSSFATAITTGKIGANLKKEWYRPGLAKNQVFSELSGLMRSSNELRTFLLIREGRFIVR